MTTNQPNEFGRLISQKITSESDTFYHHYDALGSTVALTDSSEVVTDEYAFEAFGETAAESGATPNPYQWVAQVGYRKDEETSLYDLRRRNYDDSTGRFISEDPVRSDEENLYRYVGNRASVKADPSGLQNQPGYRERLADLYSEIGDSDAAVRLRRAKQISNSLLSPFIVAIDATDGAILGLKIGAKAVVNGSATAIVNTVTLGFNDHQIELLVVSDEERAAGYDQAIAFATAGGEILIGVATGGAASALSNGGKVARLTSGGLAIFDAAGNAVGVVKGSIDVAQNGLTLQNSLQVVGSGVGLVGNAVSLKGKKYGIRNAPETPQTRPRPSAGQRVPTRNNLSGRATRKNAASAGSVDSDVSLTKSPPQPRSRLSTEFSENTVYYESFDGKRKYITDRGQWWKCEGDGPCIPITDEPTEKITFDIESAKAARDAREQLLEQGAIDAPKIRPLASRPRNAHRWNDLELQSAVDQIHVAEFGAGKGKGIPISVTATKNGRVVVSQVGKKPGPRARAMAKELFGDDVEFVAGTTGGNAPGIRGHDAEARAIEYLGTDAQGARQATTHFACPYCEVRQVNAGVTNITGTQSQQGNITRPFIEE